MKRLPNFISMVSPFVKNPSSSNGRSKRPNENSCRRPATRHAVSRHHHPPAHRSVRQHRHSAKRLAHSAKRLAHSSKRLAHNLNRSVPGPYPNRHRPK